MEAIMPGGSSDLSPQAPVKSRQVPLQIVNRVIEDLMLLQKGIYLHPRAKSKQLANLLHRQRPHPDRRQPPTLQEEYEKHPAPQARGCLTD